MKLSINSIIAIAVFLLLAACGNTGTHEAHPKQDNPTPADTSAATVIKPAAGRGDSLLTTHIRDIYRIYLQMQQALAKDKPDVVITAARQMITSLEHFKDNRSDTTHLVYNTQRLHMQQSVAEIAGSNDLEKQRTAFGSLSGSMFELLKFYGSDKPVYQAFCPMAFNDKGGSWLSDKAVVQNPYYGNDMLECGEIVTVIRK